MATVEPVVDASVHTLRTVAIARPREGVVRLTCELSSRHSLAGWNASSIAEWLQFPGVSPFDYRVRRFDAERGILDIDVVTATSSSTLKRWVDTMEIGAITCVPGPRSGHLPNFGSGRRVHVFADDSAVSTVHSILEQWPPSTRGTVWIDTPSPDALAQLPVVDGVAMISFHVDMGFDALVTAARRVNLDSSSTVWAAGERSRMDAIRATCVAAGLGADDTRVFGYWSDGR